MDRDSFQRWLDDYLKAWETYDAEAIGALFTEDAEYRWHPWDEGSEMVAGRAAIVDAWLGDRDEPGSWSAEYRPFAVEGEDAVAVGISRYFDGDGSIDKVYDNVFLCRFDGEGRCRGFTEFFMRRPDATAT